MWFLAYELFFFYSLVLSYSLILGWLGSTGTQAQLGSVSPQCEKSGGSLHSTPATQS